jgi:hypothetical protein
MAGANLPVGTPVNITGAATDNGGGLVAGVNVSVDGGATWNRATGTDSWSFTWTPTAIGTVTIRSLAVDDSGNAQNPPAEIEINVTVTPSLRVFDNRRRGRQQSLCDDSQINDGGYTQFTYHKRFAGYPYGRNDKRALVCSVSRGERKGYSDI